jgi:GT2 family glycosyltransferase
VPRVAPYVAVLIACYNRLEVTLEGLKGLTREIEATDCATFKIFLVDDASPDGTGAAVQRQFPDVCVIRGTGDLFWNGGMRLAHASARASRAFDAYLLFNDDVCLDSYSLKSLSEEFLLLNSVSPTILVGAFRSSEVEAVTYSGYRELSRLRLLSFEVLSVGPELQACDTFNGNCVLVPGDFFDANGGLDRHFIHALGDIDLGLRARRHGVRSVVFPNTVGTCERGKSPSQRLRELGLIERLRFSFVGPYGAGQVLYFAWQHRPRALWAGYFVYVVASRLKRAVFPGAR